MSTAGTPADQGGIGAFVRRHWRIVAVLVIGLGPFIPSIIAMQDFLLADNALGFTPFALPLALYLLWLRAHGDRGPGSRDVMLDLFFIVPSVLAAAFILFVTPASLSWYFWLNRMDLAALAPWMAAVAFAFLGYQQVLRTWPAWILLIFTWPYPAVWLQGHLTTLFVDATVWMAQVVVGFLRLPYETDPAFPEVFVSTHLAEDDNFILVIGQLCSGTSTTFGFMVVGSALALMSRGRASRRLWWLLAGTALAFASNLVRVSVLMIVATEASRETAVDQVHPILGIVLFCLVTVVMLLLMRPFGLRFDPVPHGRRLVWEPVSGGGTTLRLVWAGILAAAFGIGLGVVQAQEFDFIGLGEGAPSISVDSEQGILPEVEGWDRYHVTQIMDGPLRPATSRGDVFSYAQPNWVEGDAEIGVQTVVTADQTTLNRYSLEQCIDFHNRKLLARRTVDLGYGITGYVLHQVVEDAPASVVYWQMPVNVGGEVRHARIALFGDTNAPTTYEGAPTVGDTSSPASVRLGQVLDTAMSVLPSGEDDPEREAIDRGLITLAISIVDTMVTTGGPGLDAPTAEATPSAAPTSTLVPTQSTETPLRPTPTPFQPSVTP